MKIFQTFVLGFIGFSLGLISSAFALENRDELLFKVEDKTQKPFIIRPYKPVEDDKGLIELSSSSQEFITSEWSQECGRSEGFLRQFTKEVTGHIIEKIWVVIDPQENKIVGEFNYQFNEGTAVIHPHYRNKGLGIASKLAVYEYLKTQIGKPDLILTLIENLSDDEEREETTSNPVLAAKNYEDFKQILSSSYKVSQCPYRGFVGDVAYENVASLRMYLATKLTVQRLRGSMIRFVFPPAPETENLILRSLVERLVSKDESERLAAQNEFSSYVSENA